MRRFVLLYHECPPEYVRASHWDLMFEYGARLRVWAMMRLPQTWQAWHERTESRLAHCAAPAESNSVCVEQLQDHRLDYLHLEGQLSGNRGRVVRVAQGAYTEEAERMDWWQCQLETDEWQGQVILRQLGDSPHWKFDAESR